MATIKFEGIDEYAAKLSVLGKAAIGICKYASYDAADIVCDAIKANCPVSDDKRSSGDLKESIGLAKFRDDNGYIYTQVVFAGYDKKGSPMPLVARALESGRSGGAKHPFVRPAVNSVKKAAEASIKKNLDAKLAEIMK